VQKTKKIYIIMEYCNGGDLAHIIKRSKKNNDLISEEIIWKIFTQVLMALHVCHSRKDGPILHRDIKPANIFIGSNQHMKLGDFGLSKALSKNSMYAETNVGTPYYMSPEQIEERYNEK
jgi:serine/threonine protein kinase